MDKFINLRLMARPGNWIKVFLMLLFAVILYDLLTTWNGSKSGASANAGTESQ